MIIELSGHAGFVQLGSHAQNGGYFPVLRFILHKLYLGLMAVVVKLHPAPQQVCFAGQGSVNQLCVQIRRDGCRSVLIITDTVLMELGIVRQIRDVLAAEAVEIHIYDGILPDPSYALVEAGVRLGQEQNCDSVLAIGGGSSIDTAKMVAASLGSGLAPKTIEGYFKVKSPPLPLYAVPTTAGTGAEVSMGAVITDKVSQDKKVIIDPQLMPLAVALDSSLMTGLPRSVTVATGIDALTHAVEAHICSWANDQTRRTSGRAVILIFDNLPRVLEDGNNIEARQAMSLAAYYAGCCLNSCVVGNVHAIAHQLGAKYGIAHGLANALNLVAVLRYSCAETEWALADLALRIGLDEGGGTESELAGKFIEAVQALCDLSGVPRQLDALRREDIPSLAADAAAEGFGYPVKKLMSKADAARILDGLLVE